ncbi:MAG TPA: hypothetical protein ENH34_03035 [Phycisphaerales bacterium]|nr:hypothetical protein [Phycisphaerales bacterium]
MKKIYMFFIVGVLACPAAFSATRTIVRETKGYGITRDEAIRKALAEAVAQARGVEISSGRYEFGYRSASADIERKKAGKKVEFDAVSVQTGGSVLKTEIEGLVKTYEVLNEKKIDDNTYEVTLKVWVYDYEAPGRTDRIKLAVMPIKTLRQRYQFGNFLVSATDLSRKLAQKLSVGLTETNKFAVLDREYVSDFARNRNILVSDDSSLEEKAKLGKVLGADYMIVGTISEARVRIKEKTSSAIGHPIREYEADFVFDYRLIVGPTRQVRLADTVDISLETEDVKKLVKEWEPEDLDFREMMDNLVAKAANQVVETIIDRLYPIRIAGIDENGQIIINQGGKRISKGLVLDIFTEGREIYDVDTKETLGKTEILIATIRIDKVTPKISYAKLIKGDLSKISEGLICRQKKIEEHTVEGFKSDIERTPGGGVKLPFDR